MVCLPAHSPLKQVKEEKGGREGPSGYRGSLFNSSETLALLPGHQASSQNNSRSDQVGLRPTDCGLPGTELAVVQAESYDDGFTTY